jgi:hypothetical protein
MMTNYGYEYCETTTTPIWQNTQDERGLWNVSADRSTGPTNGNTSTDMWIIATLANELS